MQCILSESNKKSNTAKRVNISLESDKYTSIYRQITRHKMRRIQSKKKNTKWKHMKLSKYHSCFGDKRFF